jgi:FK506-binding protein 1
MDVGFLKDGTNKRFDSSRDRDKPFRFKVGAEQVIPGLDKGIQQLSTHERAKIIIPYQEAYGERGFPGLIPKCTDLIFDIELLSFT